jgi:hypothetical protein
MSYIDVKEVGLLNEDGQLINPAQDETILLLRRLLNQTQTLATRDNNNVLRVNLTQADGGVSIANYGGVPPGSQVSDWARTAYNTGIRANITFS